VTETRGHSVDEILMLCFAGDRIAEASGVVDVLSRLRQLGVLPAAPSSEA